MPLQQTMTESQLREFLLQHPEELEKLRNASRFRRENKLSFYAPYSKQAEFHRNKNRVKIFSAANRVGKTEAGAAEVAYHLTGLYPDWWDGIRFDSEVVIWVAAPSYEMAKVGIQTKLLGPVNYLGEGYIPKNKIVMESLRTQKNVSDVYSNLQVRHVSNRNSHLSFKSYDQGRDKFQAEGCNFLLFDEEPPWDIFSEGLTRTADKGGHIGLTFTPLSGMTEVMMHAIANRDNPDENKKVGFINATWEDAPHLSEDVKAQLRAVYKPHELEARTLGIPAVGSGKVYQIEESRVFVPRFQIPDYYRRCYGLDYGFANETAAVALAVDPDTGVAFVYREYYEKGFSARQNASNLKESGFKLLPGFADPSGDNASPKDGEKIAEIYREEGLDISKADNRVESGIMTVYQMLQAGTLKIFDDLPNIRNEFRFYQRDKHGKIYKKNDHLLDALRYACVSGIPNARPVNQSTSNFFNKYKIKYPSSFWTT